MAFPTDIDPIPSFQAGDTLNAAQHHVLHTNILDRVYQIQNFLGGSPGTETGGTMRLRLKNAEATIQTHTSQISAVQGLQGVPVGAIVAWGGASAPAGWKLCTGIAHGSQALKDILATVVGGSGVVGNGGASDFTPDLRDKFILGKGGTLPAVGGVQQVTLTAAQSGIPAHNHGAWADATNTDHLHTFTTNGMDRAAEHGHSAWTGGGGAHNHQVKILEGSTAAGDGAGFDSGATEKWNDYPPNGETMGGGDHNHPLGVGNTNTDHLHGGTTNGADRAAGQAHSHTIYTSNNAAANATQAHNIMNPYYALSYIIKT